MSHTTRRWTTLALMLFAVSGTGAAQAAMTADDAVKIALQKNTQVIDAEAGVLDAKSGLYGAYSGILPSMSASYSWFNTVVDEESGGRVVGGGVITAPLTTDFEAHGTTPSLSGRWSVLNISNIKNFNSARSNLKASNLQRTSTRNDVVYTTRNQFYQTVGVYHLAVVAAGALRVSRDNERRVQALFTVGSVSRSDLLKAQVRTAQSELDSLTAAQQIVVQRILLAQQIGIPERELGDIDTVLVAEERAYDEAALVTEAAANRPDLQAAEAAVQGAKSSRSAARFLRFPYLALTAGMNFDPESRSTLTQPSGSSNVSSTVSTTNSEFQSTLSLNWDFFDGLSTDSRNAATQARLVRATEARDALKRNLESQVHRAVITYQEAAERQRVASGAFESAMENLKLIQQKYNVGSSTILDLVDAQEQATKAAADIVTARATMRIAEAAIELVRGRGE